MAKKLQTHVVSGSKGRKALTSPIRLEILGQFTTEGGMSIADIAARMGRAPGSLYYHFGLLESAGILKRVGSRAAGPREEALYAPVARRIALAAGSAQSSAGADAKKAMASAFRMAERDFAAALEPGSAVEKEGAQRNFYASRIHCRLSPASLAKLNRHLDAIESVLGNSRIRQTRPSNTDQFVSLTLALLPLKGRDPMDEGSAQG